MGAGPSWRAVAVAGALLVMLAWGGCSVEKNYKLLSFFFDGVPEPPSPETLALERRAGGGGLAGGMVSAHTAYLDRRCTVCHGDQASFGFTTTGFSDMGSHVCPRCHDVLENQPAFVHGPVALGACLLCHDPHASEYPVLLVAPSPELCLQCHDLHIQGEPTPPFHEDHARDCLECHDGHGSEHRYLLKDSWISGVQGPPPPEPPADPET